MTCAQWSPKIFPLNWKIRSGSFSISAQAFSSSSRLTSDTLLFGQWMLPEMKRFQNEIHLSN
eukprot:1183490-Prorocentrum_minimum.AAC.4